MENSQFTLDAEKQSLPTNDAQPCYGTLDLRLGDCMDVMATFADGHFDLAIVDPPYGIGIVSQFKKTT
jgi:23S rRNA G2069 N7-methylase RlmK/C1962 C5-methylase RlmI